jgi:hypothetical protein
MRNAAWCVLALSLIAASGIADDASRIIQLEQDVHKLERRTQDLSREIEELRRQLERSGIPSAGRAGAPGPAASPSTAWLNAATWQRVRPGMSELEVISLLGPPTSMRADDGARMLLYATEIGSSGFLAGSVTLKDRQVTDISPPVLK